MTEPDDRVTASADRSPDAPGGGVAPSSPGPAPAEGHRRAHGLTESGKVRRTRASSAYVALVLVALLALLVLVFIAQNTEKVAISFLGFDGRFPLGVAILFAVVVGALMVALPGAVRIIQLRRALRRNDQELHQR